MMSANRAKFRLSDAEIEIRRKFVNDSKRKAQVVIDDMNSPDTRGKIETDARAVSFIDKTNRKKIISKSHKHEQSKKQRNKRNNKHHKSYSEFNEKSSITNWWKFEFKIWKIGRII